MNEKTPKYTDGHRWPHGYRKAIDTSVAETFARVRAQQQANNREAEQKVARIQTRRKSP